jgi:predicted nucleic acid-binding protein
VAPEAWVSDSSPLILLGKIGRLDLMIGSSERLLIPQAVADEVAAKSDGIRLIAELSTEARITFVPSVIVPSELSAWGLGPGETQVIACARQYAADRAILDDLEARRCAAAMGIKTIGTLGLVARAKYHGRIEQAAPVLMRLRKTGLYVSNEVIARILQEVGE